MKQYTIKSTGSDPSVLELLRETEGGYQVRITHRHDDWEDVQEDFLSKELFEACLRTGYIIEIPEGEIAYAVLSA